ncbi:uncharacterized protein Z519_05357 [Cladophialophora bantiana CBS 173.52]|uniref:Uncharacterized protein n=1 Tax=Cladophialophora bantiana (strain ATCC 10958 / CBS 173.52 / CDC B-1940 / NIH 8579) TaxID=1442370 RepID=A0A0D2EW57_CLAB1|nr:uncharacterized protein Z519_05357 [Cladophialophora bantiana CBS 173.52]KIW94041.1 hypothetical protein Z519_05357 [Cladophialophora bantiana CBS 173.52]
MSEPYSTETVVPLRGLYLGFVVTLSSGLAAAMEYLYQRANELQGEGKALIRNFVASDLGNTKYLLWRYMRLAPFYNPRRPNGLSGTDSFLQDPDNYLTYP